jgi:AbrB family looped-hinge helix DNA binding protein
MPAFATTKMSSRGQVVIPEPIRRQMGLEAGDRFVVFAHNDTIVVKKINPPSMKDFEAMIRKARRQAKLAGLKRADVAEAIAAVRRRK